MTEHLVLTEPSLPGTAQSHMDDEQLVAASRGATTAALQIIDLIGAESLQHQVQPELEETARELAESLHAILQFMPKRDDEGDQLLEALERWLP